MCGLVATVSFESQPADEAQLRRMSDSLVHRGPDDSGHATYGPVGFGFRRLAILDLSPAGHQPMEMPDGSLSIVFNGEIYNYLELKAELLQLGRTFRSSSDTEVLLHAYDQWGPQCVERFNGMWAFVIYDGRRRRVIASRDRFGVKPLYQWSDGKRLVLASEIKAIVASGWYEPAVNWPAAAKFLYRGHVDEGTETLYQGVEQVAPGSVVEIELNGSRRERRFWSIDALQDEPPADPIGEFRRLFEDSVRLRMRSDVPVGVCLSGGIDSSAIISMMATLRAPTVNYPLQAFSYIPEEFSEITYIRESVAQTGAVLNQLGTTPRDLWELMPKAIWHYDEPVHSPTALIGFQLMRLAKSRGVTVVLNGQGADEVNAGYHGYFKSHWTDLLREGHWISAFSQVHRYSSGNGQAYGSLLRRTLGHWVRCELRRIPGFRQLRDPIAAATPPEADWFSGDLRRQLPPADLDSWTKPLSFVLTHSVERRPLPLYLRVEDRNSMAHSVESRLPFLDYRLVALAFSLPGHWKLRDGWNKYVVREALRGVIAESVRTRRDKMGFPTPSKSWWGGAWYEPMRDLLDSSTLRQSGICAVDRVAADLDRHSEQKVDVSSNLFRLAEFGRWLELCPTARHRGYASDPKPLPIDVTIPHVQKAGPQHV